MSLSDQVLSCVAPELDSPAGPTLLYLVFNTRLILLTLKLRLFVPTRVTSGHSCRTAFSFRGFRPGDEHGGVVMSNAVVGYGVPVAAAVLDGFLPLAEAV